MARLVRSLLRRPPGRLPHRLVAGALVALFVVSAFPGLALAQERARIAVLPVVIHAMEEQAYLQEGLADMLSARLAQHIGIGVIRVDEAAAATTDPDEARAHGRSAGGDWVVFGSFTHFGNGASLDLRCVRVDGSDPDETRSIFVQTGSLEQIIPRLTNMADRLAAHIHAGPVADVAAPPTAAAAAAPRDDAELQALKRRVEALEATVYEEHDLAAEE